MFRMFHNKIQVQMEWKLLMFEFLPNNVWHYMYEVVIVIAFLKMCNTVKLFYQHIAATFEIVFCLLGFFYVAVSDVISCVQIYVQKGIIMSCRTIRHLTRATPPPLPPTRQRCFYDFPQSVEWSVPTAWCPTLMVLYNNKTKWTGQEVRIIKSIYI